MYVHDGWWIFDYLSKEPKIKRMCKKGTDIFTRVEKGRNYESS